MALKHGGNVNEVAARSGIPAAQWLDLSTGISPYSWPVPPVPDEVWRALPQSDDGLEDAAATYFGCEPRALLAVPGSQTALQLLPRLVAGSTVALPQRGYAEHAHAWRSAGHACHYYRDPGELQSLVDRGRVAHAVVINPNNPTTTVLDPAVLLALGEALNQRGGFLLVDEAFVDAVPHVALADQCPAPGLVVLRSLGKFFGLAGLRLGFVLAAPALLGRMETALPPWAVSHPARWVASQALADRQWVASQRSRLLSESADWLAILDGLLPRMQCGATPLFVVAEGEFGLCEAVYQSLCRDAILVRQFDEEEGVGMLRFGLPHARDRDRVVASLRCLFRESPCALG